MSFKEYEKAFINNVKAMESNVMEFSWEDSYVYQMWLSQTYYIVRHTSHFVCLAAGLVPVENRDEHYHLIQHLREEQNHDLLLVSDLKYFNQKFDDFVELPETALVWQNLYYWLSLRKPRAILGHSLCIEGLAGYVGHKVVERLQKTLPPKATQFLKVHFEADQKHFEEGLSLMKTFSNEDLEDILKVQMQSSSLYLNMLRKVEEYARTKQVVKKSA